MNHKGTIMSYVIGFILSLVLTIAAFIPVFMHQSSHHVSFSHEFLLPFILGLAIIQLIVQLVFFLHLGREAKPYFNLVFLSITAGMIIIVVVASLWIMNHLNYNMTPDKMDSFLMQDEGYHK